VKYKGVEINLPSVTLVNGKVAVDSGNMFDGLDVEPVSEVDDSLDLGSNCDDN
jgi:hypothetical protein